MGGPPGSTRLRGHGSVKRQIPILRNRLRVPSDDLKRAIVRVRSAVDHDWDQSPVEPNESLDAVFIWIPKNAGTSVTRALADHGLRTHSPLHRVRYGFEQRGLVSFGHMDYFKLVQRGFVSPRFHERSFKFAIVRNPFDRIVSLYSYLRNGNRLSKRMDFRDFVFRITQRPIPDIGFYRDRGLSSCNPQSRWLRNEADDIGVDLIGRVEALPQFMDELADRLQIQLNTTPHENRSERDTSYRTYYDRETRLAVATRFSDDLDRFDYDF